MAQYAVGDIQGCYDPLVRLLDRVQFDPAEDTLVCVGDLVNRGPKSLKTIRFLKSLGASCTAVLGNHDIHLLAMIYGVRTPKPNDTLHKILRASDLQELTVWLRSRPLLVRDKTNKTLVCHAGIYPWWNIQQALDRAAEVESIFSNEQQCIKLLKKIYSNSPSRWSEDLGQTRRARFIINAFTRMRFCSPRGHLNLSESGYSGVGRKNRVPWFEFYNPGLENYRVVFGHWSALGFLNKPQYLCLDSGFVWGRDMTMVKLPNKPKFKKIPKRNIHRFSSHDLLLEREG